MLDQHSLLNVQSNSESRVRVTQGQAPAGLVEQAWRTFLIKIQNEAGVTAALRAASPQALRVFSRGARGFSMDPPNQGPRTERRGGSYEYARQVYRQRLAESVQ